LVQTHGKIEYIKLPAVFDCKLAEEKEFFLKEPIHCRCKNFFQPLNKSG